MSKIEWTDKTWNPVTGCTPMSAGCYNCYARVMHKRLQGMGLKQYQNDFDTVKCHEDLLFPKFRKKPAKIFVCSMSDLFHKDVPDVFISGVMDVCMDYPQHTFQFLTKRADRLVEWNFPPNAWVGVTVESEAQLFRIDYLEKVVARIKFVSFEPFLFVDIDMNWNKYIKNLDWVIAGGETGIYPRGIIPLILCRLLDTCLYLKIPFFFKQWHQKGQRVLGEKEWNEFPRYSSGVFPQSSLRVQE